MINVSFFNIKFLNKKNFVVIVFVILSIYMYLFFFNEGLCIELYKNVKILNVKICGFFKLS